MKNKLFLLLPALALVFGMSACDNGSMNGKGTSGNSSNTSQSTSTSSGTNNSSVTDGSSGGNQSSDAGGTSSEDAGIQNTDYSFKVNDGTANVFTTEGAQQIVDDTEEVLGMQYQFQLNVEAEQVLTFFKGAEAIYPGAGSNPGNEANNVSYNISTHELKVVKNAENSTCYLKVYSDGYAIWLTGNEGGTGGGNFDPDEGGGESINEELTFKINSGAATTFAKETGKDIKDGDQNVIGREFYATITSISKNDVLTFYSDGTEIHPGASGTGNNAVWNEGTVTVHNDAENVKLYFKYYFEDEYNPGHPGYDLWLEGYVGAPATTTLYFKPNDDWASASAKFALYFDGGIWVEGADSDSDGIWEFSNPNGLSKLIIVRVGPSQTIPLNEVWEGKWNQSPADGWHNVPEGMNMATMTGTGYENWNYYPIAWSLKA